MSRKKTLKPQLVPTGDSTPGWLASAKSLLMPLALAVATSAASIFAYVLTPLNELVNTAFWDEKAEIHLISTSLVPQEGDVLAVELFVQPQSPVPLSAGLIKIAYSEATLRPTPDTIPLLANATKKIESSTKLLDKPLEFIATSPGSAEVTATLTTKTGTFTKTLSLNIAASSGQKHPTRRSFSGLWNIDLGSIHGQMELTEIARTITGSYSLSDGNRGLIEGTRDGKTFRVTLYRGSAPSRFFVEASFDPNPAVDLEVIGKARLLVPTGDENNPWKEARQSDFHAVARAR